MPVLKAISKNHDLVAVVTQPPKQVGRDQKISRSPVDDFAFKRKIPLFFDFEKAMPEADLGVVASYGKIIPQILISHFKFGILNIHPSLLPKQRGASPIQATILTGETGSGVTVIKMDEKMDHGPIVSFFREEVKKEDTSGTLRQRLFERSAQFLVDLIPGYLNQKIKLKPQDHNQATFTKILSKEDGFIQPVFLKKAMAGETIQDKWPVRFLDNLELTPTPENIARFVRAMDPWPGTWTRIKLKNKEIRLKVLSCKVEMDKLLLEKVQLEGKNPVSWEEFKRGYPDSAF